MNTPASKSPSTPEGMVEATEWQRLDDAADRNTGDECENSFNIGRRDGFGEAVQLIDTLTGGDGEYRFCIGLDDLHCPDPDAMIVRIVGRLTPKHLTPSTSSAGAEVERLREALRWIIDEVGPASGSTVLRALSGLSNIEQKGRTALYGIERDSAVNSDGAGVGLQPRDVDPVQAMAEMESAIGIEQHFLRPQPDEQMGGVTAEVTQADREVASGIVQEFGYASMTITSETIAQAFARHRRTERERCARIAEHAGEMAICVADMSAVPRGSRLRARGEAAMKIATAIREESGNG